MSSTVGDTLPLAVAVALSPAPIIALVLVMLSLRAKTNGLAYLLGWLVGLVVALAIVLALVNLLNVAPGTEPSTLASIIRLLVGVLLLYLGIRQWRSRPKAGEEPRTPGWMVSVDTFSPAQAFGLALLLSSFGNLALVLAAGLAIGRAKLAVPQEVVAAAIFVFLSSLIVIAVVVYYSLARESASAMLSSWKAWLLANSVALTSVLFVIVGTILVGKGISGLGLLG